MLKLTALIVLLSVAPAVLASPTIIVGNTDLLADQAGQKVYLYITGGDQLQNVNLSVQIGDGGPELGGVIDGPSLSNIDIFAGTIFDGNNTGRASLTPDGVLTSQVGYEGTTTATGFVTGNGLLATITLDTTGWDGGVFDLRLTGTHNGDTSFANATATGLLPVSITNGTITVVPEPATVTMMLLGVALLRRRRAA
jgi:hypothetical protein